MNEGPSNNHLFIGVSYPWKKGSEQIDTVHQGAGMEIITCIYDQNWPTKAIILYALLHQGFPLHNPPHLT